MINISDNNNEQEFDKFCNLLINLDTKARPLWKNGKDMFNKKLNNHTIKNYTRLHTEIPRISGVELQEEINKKSRSLNLNLEKKIYLPPLGRKKDSEFIPTLSVKCNFKKDPKKMKIYIELYRYKKLIETIEGEDIEFMKVLGFGFRFESPHSGSSHNYWHVQVTNGPDDTYLPGCPDWIPQSTPCLPMKANCPITLMCTMLLSLYGILTFREMYNILGVGGEYIEPILDIIEQDNP